MTPMVPAREPSVTRFCRTVNGVHTAVLFTGVLCVAGAVPAAVGLRRGGPQALATES